MGLTIPVGTPFSFPIRAVSAVSYASLSVILVYPGADFLETRAKTGLDSRGTQLKVLVSLEIEGPKNTA
jgi:hypothetical protein